MGETIETVTDFIFLGSQVTANGECRHEIKRHLLLGRKFMTHLDSILKSRDITLPTKVCLVKAMVFPVVMYGCVSWTIKLSTEELMLLNYGVFRRLLWVPWTARRSNQSILREISPECSLEGLMWKLKLQILWPPDLERPCCWERLKVGGEVDDRGWDGWMASLTQWTWVRVKPRGWWWTGKPDVLRSMGSQRVGHDWKTELNCSVYLTENAQAYFWSIVIINKVCVLGTVVFKFFVLYSFSPFIFYELSFTLYFKVFNTLKIAKWH